MPNLPGVSKPPRGTVDYNLHLAFGILYEVKWSVEQGIEDDDCIPWRVDSGTNEVAAFTTRGGVHDWIPGHAQIYPRLTSRAGGWANVFGAGSAEALLNRRWLQEGGSDWVPACDGTDPGFRPSPDDCAGGHVREYNDATAAIYAGMRDGKTSVLESLTTSQKIGTRRAKIAALALSIGGKPLPYRRCKTSSFAPELPGNLGFLLPPKKGWVSALRNLGPGKKTVFRDRYSGDCAADLPDDVTCTFKLEMTIEIRRWRKGIPYP